MTTYRNIHGRSIQAVTTDPTESVAEGQVWYNTTSDTFKSIVSLEAWASSASMVSGRSILGRAGSQTDALAIGGYYYPGSPEDTVNVEEYNGSGWSEGPNLNEARYGMQCDGTATSALAAGGISPGSPEFKTNSEEWDGSSWTATPAINTERGYVGHAGTSTASIIFGGRVSGPSTTNASESWNGSSWTATLNLNTSGWGRYGGGTSTAALSTGTTPH